MISAAAKESIPRNYGELAKAIQDSYDKLRPFRETNREIVEEWVGNRYSDETKRMHKSLVNQLAQSIETFSIHMVPQRPAVNITTNFSEYKPTAASLKLAVNNELQNMNIETVLESVVTNAWMRIGIAKIGISSGNYKRIENEVIDIGRLFASSVSLENWVHDMSATEFDRCGFYGDRYLITSKEMRQMPLYDPKYHQPSKPGDVTFESDANRIKYVEHAPDYESNVISDDKVEVWDIWVTDTNKVITFLSHSDMDATFPLRVVDWRGPKEGPYKFLRFNPVPECTMPAAIAPHLVDLHITMNNLLRKQLDSAKRKKEVFLYKQQNKQEAEKIRDANDFDMVGTTDPTNVQSVKFGDIDQQIQQFLMMTDQFFDRQAGNLTLLAGLGASSGTVGQEQLLQSNSSSRMNLYKGKVRRFIRDLASDVAWWLWHNPNYDPPIFKELPEVDLKIETRLKRIGEFIDYNFDIEPYSIEYNPPELKLQKLTGILQQLMGALPLMQQQGINIDFQKLIETYADYASLPELKDVMTFERPPQEGVPMSDRPAKPANTSREYNYNNRSVQTEDGFRKQMMQSMAGRGDSDQ